MYACDETACSCPYLNNYTPCTGTVTCSCECTDDLQIKRKDKNSNVSKKYLFQHESNDNLLFHRNVLNHGKVAKNITPLFLLSFQIVHVPLGNVCTGTHKPLT